MSSFTTPLVVKCPDYRHGDTNFVLNEPFVYYTDAVYPIRRINSSEPVKTITIPQGFETDFASIPRPFWAIFPPYGRYAKAAVLHDYLCECNHFYNGRQTENDPQILSLKLERKTADDVFLEAMKVLGVGRITRSLIYASVRAYAWLAHIR